MCLIICVCVSIPGNKLQAPLYKSQDSFFCGGFFRCEIRLPGRPATMSCSLDLRRGSDLGSHRKIASNWGCN